MEVVYPLKWVLEIVEEMRFADPSRVGASMSFKRAGNPRRFLIPILSEIPDYILIDNAEAALVLEEYKKARDKIVKHHSI